MLSSGYDKISEQALCALACRYGTDLNIDPALICGIVETESSRNVKAKSSVAYGLMQMTSIALEDTKLNYDCLDMFDDEKAIEAGTRYLSLLKKRLYKHGIPQNHPFFLVLLLLSYAYGMGNTMNWLDHTTPDNAEIDEILPSDKKDYIFNVLFWYNYYKNKICGV